jgi:hypothetical protein
MSWRKLETCSELELPSPPSSSPRKRGTRTKHVQNTTQSRQLLNQTTFVMRSKKKSHSTALPGSTACSHASTAYMLHCLHCLLTCCTACLHASTASQFKNLFSDAEESVPSAIFTYRKDDVSVRSIHFLIRRLIVFDPIYVESSRRIPPRNGE